MEQQRVRKTFKDQLMPTPEQERALQTVVWRCRDLYNAGLEERKAVWETCRVRVSCARQSAPRPASKDVRPDYRDRNAPVVQEVRHRLDKTFQACFRRVQNCEQPGSPRVQGTDRSDRVT